jgi:hypothetical protein
MGEPFDVCWERIRRANAHRDAIAAAWNAFIEEEPYDAHVDVDDNGWGFIRIEQTAAIPAEIPLEFGEFLYQLRAALDASIYETACLNTVRRPPADEDKLEFPVCFSPESFDSQSWKIAPLTDQQRDIVKAIQPYTTPSGLTPAELPYSLNRAIGILNDWARKDRHRKLHVIATQASNVRPLLRLPPGVTLARIAVIRDAFVLENQHCEVAGFQIDGWQRGMNVQANPNLTLDIGVDEIPAPCSEIDRFEFRTRAMGKAVSAVINGLAETVRISPPPDIAEAGVIRATRQNS